MRTLFKEARILSMKDDQIIFSNLVVDGERIKYIGNDYSAFEPFDRIVECNGNLLMPGFKNAHSHAGMCFVRNLADDKPLEEWLFDFILPAESKLDFDSVRLFSKLTFAECIASGITYCDKLYYFNPYIEQAANEVGMRCHYTGNYHINEYEYKDLESDYLNHINNHMVAPVAGIHSVYINCPEEIAAYQKLVHEYKIPFYLHACETEVEVNNCMKNKNGRTPIEVVNDWGLFDYGGGVFHGVHLTDNDRKILKEKDVSIITNPCSNAKLASGVADIKKALDFGINVAIGTDGPASNNNLDMFKEMYMLAMLQSLKYKNPIVLKPFDILKMATVNGSRAMRLVDCDTLEAGKYADIIMIDLHTLNMLPMNNIINSLVYSCSQRNIKLTMINGKILYENGKFSLDEPIEKIVDEAIKKKEELFGK